MNAFFHCDKSCNLVLHHHRGNEFPFFSHLKSCLLQEFLYEYSVLLYNRFPLASIAQLLWILIFGSLMQLKVNETYLASEAEGYGFYFHVAPYYLLLPLKIIQSLIVSVSQSEKGGQYYLILRFALRMLWNGNH